MAKIQIKRGLQSNVEKLLLSQGELAVALDTGNLYVGTESGKVHLNPDGGTADEASKLKNAREFSISGDGSAQPVTFDGTGNVELILSLATMPGLTAGTYTKLTVDGKGRVTGASNIEIADLPSIPASKITGLGTAASQNTGKASGNVVVVESNGKIADCLIPSLAISETFEAESEAAMLALSCQKGDICIRTDENKSYILSGDGASVLANWKWLRTPDCKVLSVNGKTGAVTLSAADVGAEPLIKNAGVKEAPVDADSIAVVDSAASNATKRLTFTALKAYLKTYFDGLYNKYVHPTYTQKASGLYKFTVDGTGHVSATAAVAKADITALGIPAQDTVYTLPQATASTLGGVKVGSGLVSKAGVVSVGDIDGGTF